MLDNLLKNESKNRLVSIKDGFFLHANDNKISQSIEAYGEANRHESDLYLQLLNKGDVVIEVGARSGHDVLKISNKIGSEGTIFAFEMKRLRFQLLCANVALNSLLNVEAYSAVVTDSSGSGQLTKGGKSESVELITLDSIIKLQKIKNIKMLKIAASSMDQKPILKGAKQFILNKNPVIYIEKGIQVKILLNFIFSLQYRVYVHNASLFNEVNILENKVNIFPGEVLSNFLCLPKKTSQNISGLTEIFPKGKVKKGTPIKVAFFVNSLSKWKSESVFCRMAADDNFIPKIFISPSADPYSEIGKLEMHEIFKYTQEKGYLSEQTLLKNGTGWLDVQSTFGPNVVFFPNHYLQPVEQYNVQSFYNALTCYIPYHHQNASHFKILFDTPFHCEVDKLFYRSKDEKKAAENTVNKGVNVEITGEPGAEHLLNRENHRSWAKPIDQRVKIILAPHHSMAENRVLFEENVPGISTFLMYSDFFIELAKKYCNEVVFAFKPHPDMKANLDQMWGEKKTEEYYSFWSTQENTLLEVGEYASLFAGSDAMIHDCGSFTVEYLYMKKPAMYLVKNTEQLKLTQNQFGQDGFNAHYHANSKEDIEKFVLQVIDGTEDPKKGEREAFFNKYLVQDELASVKIVNSIKKACFDD